MNVTQTNTGRVHLDCDDAHILHLKDSGDYPDIRHVSNINAEDIDKWEELALADIPAYTKEQYNAEVESLIARRYSPGEEAAIKRKALAMLLNPAAVLCDDDGNPPPAIAEFHEYNEFAEACKVQAKANLTIKRAIDDNE